MPISRPGRRSGTTSNLQSEKQDAEIRLLNSGVRRGLTAKPDGVVTDEQFMEFLDRIITPRFPDGLTLLKGNGQFRDGEGDIIKEESFVLILLYPLEEFHESSRRINVIREHYKDEFDQESVLRVDDPFAVRVSF